MWERSWNYQSECYQILLWKLWWKGRVGNCKCL